MISRLHFTLRSFPPPASPSPRPRCPFSSPPSAAALSSTPRPSPAISSAETPLFLRPLAHFAARSDLDAFRRWARSLALSAGPRLAATDPSGPDAAHLLRELQWLLQDAALDLSAPNPNPHLGSSQDVDLVPPASNSHPGSSGNGYLVSVASNPLMGSSQNGDLVPLRVELGELYRLWRERIEERRPFQYLVGNEHWRDLVVVVREGVLIPRPETEMLVDLVAEVEGFERGLWADMGTGSGTIAVGIGRLLGEHGKVIATDLSPHAVEVARFNVERYGLKEKVEVRQGSWFEPLQDVKGLLSGLISNPPYIPSDHISGLQAEVGRHEPRLALDGGKDGMDHLLHLIEGSASALKPGGFFAFETNGDKQSEFIVDCLSTKWRTIFHNAKAIPDFAGIKRFVTGFHK